jgi:hypothetical protein
MRGRAVCLCGLSVVLLVGLAFAGVAVAGPNRLSITIVKKDNTGSGNLHEVSITGKNFTGTYAVSIQWHGSGGEVTRAELKFTVVSATEITAILPKGVTGGTLTIRKAGGGKGIYQWGLG